MGTQLSLLADLSANYVPYQRRRTTFTGYLSEALLVNPVFRTDIPDDMQKRNSPLSTEFNENPITFINNLFVQIISAVPFATFV